MKDTIVLPAAILILFFGIALSFGQTVSEEARRHFDRGMAAVEMAKSPEDYESAIKEFEQAISLAPDWPDIYYNLGLVHEKAGNLNDAIMNLKQYLRLAPNASDAEMVKSLINKLEYRFEQSNAGDTLLHEATIKGKKEVVELLIAKGADINAKDKDGQTPLHAAVNGGYKELAELLIARGADMNAKNNSGRTPLDLARERKYKEVAKLLKKYGAK